MPLHDWQFWVVTAVAAVGLWMAFRPLFPRRRGRGKPCHGSGGVESKGTSTRATLTVEGRRAR